MGMAAPRIISFSDLERWDVKYFLGQIKSKYPLVSLAEFVTEHNEKVRPYDSPQKTFKILGVNNTDGIFHAYDALGKNIKQPYKMVSEGDFAYNPYRINVGSIGWVPPEHDGAYISPAYVVFSIDETVVLPELFWFVLKAAFFNQTLRAATAGSVRMNLTCPLLETLKIPIPPLPIQQKIVAFWEAAIVKASLLEDKSKATIDKSLCTFIHELGLSIPKKQESKKVFIRQWKDFDRWSVNYNQAASTMMDLSKGKFPVVELGAVLDLVQYGTSEKANTNQSGMPILRINNIKKGYIDSTDLKHISLGKKILKNLALSDGDILIIRTSGSRNLVGTCAVFHEKGEFVYASYLIRLRVSNQHTLSDYVSSFINSPVGRQQVNLMSRHIMQNNINSQELKSLKIPLPPLAVQRKIVECINYSRREAASLNTSAKELLEKAKIGVEQMILGLHQAERI
jgi:type I restriction enzyme S subunit